MGDWIDRTDGGLVTQSQAFSGAISSSPTTYGLVAADATALAADVTSYVNSYEASADPATRTKVTVEQKSTAKDVLVARMRSYGRRIQANPSVSSAQKVALGLHVRNTPPAPVPVPATRPVATVISSMGRSVKTRIADELTPSKRSKPAGVSEAEIFTFVGENPPADIFGWIYQGQASKTSFDVTFPASVASGAKVWICARWCNRRGEAGPLSIPVFAILTGIVAQAA
jgi:hypothetical protein